MIKKNTRIQLFKEGEMVSDRLVAQEGEFYLGPKIKHDGLIRIEFTIEDRTDAEGVIKYLKQLSMDLPLKSKSAPRAKASMNTKENDINELEQLVASLSELKDQDKFIKSMRKEGFVFMVTEYLKGMLPKAYEIKGKHLEQYDWLIKKIKVAKDPKNDKYDPRVLVGIQILHKRHKRMVVYVNGEFKETLRMTLPKKAMTFRKTNLIKYPKYMLHDERVKWGLEHRTLLLKTEQKPSRFYIRWMRDIEVGNELQLEDGRIKIPKKKDD